MSTYLFSEIQQPKIIYVYGLPCVKAIFGNFPTKRKRNTLIVKHHEQNRTKTMCNKIKEKKSPAADDFGQSTPTFCF